MKLVQFFLPFRIPRSFNEPALKILFILTQMKRSRKSILPTIILLIRYGCYYKSAFREKSQFHSATLLPHHNNCSCATPSLTIYNTSPTMNIVHVQLLFTLCPKSVFPTILFIPTLFVNAYVII